MLGGHAAPERGAWDRGHKLPSGQRREEQGPRAAGQSRVLGELAPACPAVCLKLRAMGALALPSGRCIHCAQPRMLLHTQEAFPHITSFLGNRQQGAKEVLFPFFDTCTDINIFLVPMVAIFKRGWSWLCSLSVQFYLSWTFHTSSVPWLWGQVGGFPKPLPSLVPPKIFHQRPSSSPAWGLPICWGNALRWLLPLPRGALLPSYILSKPA